MSSPEANFAETDDFVLDGGGDEAENDGKEAQSTSFHLDRLAIPSNDDELGFALSGVTAYNANQLEDGFLAQVRQISNEEEDKRVIRKRRIQNGVLETAEAVRFGDLTPFEQLASTAKKSREEEAEDGEIPSEEGEGSDYEPEGDDEPMEEDSESEYDDVNGEGIPKKGATQDKKKPSPKAPLVHGRDDGNDADFERRIQSCKDSMLTENNGEEEALHITKTGLKIPISIWNKLYKYQKTGVRWLSELHQQNVGGILADEMGLGKTIQIIAFLRSLSVSNFTSAVKEYEGLGPVLIVCPATLMHQWVREVNKWFPLCRISVYHASGSYRGNRPALLRKMATYRKEGSILVTTYTAIANECKTILKHGWHYIILDEGHKIRNPDAKMTMAIKEARTAHRLILSGSPMQNNLKELWSLIDFVYPGRLGSLKSFTEKFSIPITQGGYANATSIQVRTAYKCACVLKNAINPFMLRRMKKDVEMVLHLPDKMEQVLFCDITAEQRFLYEDYINSKECKRILSGRMDAFVGLIALRKLCNHPDFITGGPNRHGDCDIESNPEKDFGHVSRSGKMQVVKSLLRLWHEQKHKVLLFSQSRQMLTILEKFVISQGYNYLRMDGQTNVAVRQALVEKFNTDPEQFVFLLTTRVGGLGVNLTGANRIVIFDPDWNPSTDAQARERAWRIGQTRAVTIYRLLTSSTIEEKIYHRQIFKQFLVNRVLVDAKQSRFFKTNDLHELFTLGDSKTDKAHGTETAAIFAGRATVVNRENFFDKHEKERKNARKKRDETKKSNDKAPDPDDEEVDEVEAGAGNAEMSLSEERRMELREMAKKLASGEVKEIPKEFFGKKKKKEKRLFEGKYEIPYLKKQKKFKEKQEAPSDSKAQDDYVLAHLLKKTRVHSALRHDQILGDAAPDSQLVEDEANAVAKRAAASVRSKRNRSDVQPIFGRKQTFGNGLKEDEKDPDADDHQTKNAIFSGGMGGTEEAPSSGLSLLAMIRKRKEMTMDIAEGEEDVPSTSQPTGDRFEVLADELRTFFANNGSRLTTAEILERFKEKVAPRDSLAFRSILKRISFQEKESKMWVLKQEYL
ncbi:hypothetical protein QR680_017694 [Steinernema hermaphroditum]|uniref:DNA repair and recombination protein RAD54-like n=1 Tax=Steinernema hermaphroditum TaxID=289476 RepID=A0AA39LP47_9BILA|nr:hypothetical protein QR680_017694 [Steinernema hermaphroditum]